MKKIQQNLFSLLALESLEAEAVNILYEASKNGAVYSCSGGIDSTIINHIIKKFKIPINEIFFNKEVEPNGNKKIIDKIKNTYFERHEAKTESYKSIVYRLGFPIKNKNFSELCYRLKRVPLSQKNIIDKYRIVTGVSPTMIKKTKKVNMDYTLELKFWYLATNFPIQQSCCSILKKTPSAKVGKPMIIGIMADDSPARRRAINQAYHGKFFPLKSWCKNDVLLYAKLENIEISKEYKNRKVKNSNIEIVGSVNTGCIGCHFGNAVSNFIKVDGKKIATTKLDKLKIEKPKTHKSIMSMKHNSGVTFEETIRAYDDSKDGKYIKESIIIRNKMIVDIKNLMIEIGLENFDDGALELLMQYYIQEES
jgi:3'-phosphoadenosine 5'-phosphosulfate sulfotransferase (PAPS reductase)/FAD synthetase